MELRIVGSSSKGNCYQLHSEKYAETLMIEAGCKFDKVSQALRYKTGTIVGCVITHRHGDHAGHFVHLTKMGIHVLGTRDLFEFENCTKAFMRQITPGRGYQFGHFHILPLPVKHDVPCYAYLIKHPEMGKLVFITDTMCFDYRLPVDTNHVLIEANYSNEILSDNIEKGYVPLFMKNRLMESHMEIETTAGVFRSNVLNELRNVVLIHLSDRNSNAKEFQKYIQGVCGVPTYVAESGMVINIDKSY